MSNGVDYFQGKAEAEMKALQVDLARIEAKVDLVVKQVNGVVADLKIFKAKVYTTASVIAAILSTATTLAIKFL